VFVGYLVYLQLIVWGDVMESIWWKHRHCRRKI